MFEREPIYYNNNKGYRAACVAGGSLSLLYIGGGGKTVGATQINHHPHRSLEVYGPLFFQSSAE